MTGPCRLTAATPLPCTGLLQLLVTRVEAAEEHNLFIKDRMFFRLALLPLLLLFLQGCAVIGIAEEKTMSLFAIEDDVPAGDHEQVMVQARRHPKLAMISPAFYREASVQEVEEILQQVSPSDSFRVRYTKTEYGAIGPGSTPATFFLGALLVPSSTTLESTDYDPASVALKNTTNPEVIYALHRAGFSMRNRVTEYIQNGKRITFNHADGYGDVSKGLSPELLRFLLKLNPEVPDSEQALSPLTGSSARRLQNFMLFMDLAEKININHVDRSNDTLLWETLRGYGHTVETIALTLLDYGADPHLPDGAGKKVYTAALKYNHQKVLMRLRLMGINPPQETQ